MPIASHDVIVREVTPNDYAQWLLLWEGYNAFYKRSGPTALAPEITQQTWAHMLDPSVPVHGLVAERDGRLVGLTHYLFHRSTTILSETCYLQDLFTCEAARGRGVGRALIQRVYDNAVAAGSARVYWHTHETNATARLLYDKVAENSGAIMYGKEL